MDGDRLEGRRDEVAARLVELRLQFDAIVDACEGVATDDEHDPEGHTVAVDRQQVVALIADAEAELAGIDAALDRLVTGRYGRCDRCGQPIGDERLDALPSATCCVACAR